MDEKLLNFESVDWGFDSLRVRQFNTVFAKIYGDIGQKKQKLTIISKIYKSASWNYQKLDCLKRFCHYVDEIWYRFCKLLAETR